MADIPFPDRRSNPGDGEINDTDARRETDAPEVAAELAAFRVRVAYSNIAPVVIASIVNAGIVGAASFGHVPALWIAAWATGMALLVLIRFAVYSAFHRAPVPLSRIKTWERRFGAPAVLSGCLWGASGWIFIVPGAPVTQLVPTIIIAGMVAGALSSLRAHPQYFMMFSTAAVAPLAIRFFLFGQLEFLLLACAFLLFLALMIVQAINISRQLEVSELRRLENAGLIDKLNAARVAAEAANVAKSEFLATTSHEIRTPMTGVMGFADMLLDEDLPENSRSKVRKIKDATQSLLQVINDILDMSKLEAGKMEINAATFQPRLLIRAVVAQFETGDNEAVRMECAFSDDFPERAVSDSQRIRQILVNLVGNAAKFTAQGRIAVNGRLETDASGTVLIRIEVTDTGIGMTEESLANVFSSFTQADASISRGYEGAGLGLAISKRLVEMLGGSIGAESRFGAGSTFWFTIPYTEPNDPPHGEPDSRPSPGDRPTAARPLKILIAEDNLINQTIITSILEGFGHRLDVVNNGREAVNAVEASRYDLIVMDIRMPEMSGLDATRAIRAMNGERSQVPIVALTADAMSDRIQSYLAAGMNEVASKPIDRRKLALAINAALREDVHLLEAAPPDGA